MSGHDEAGDDAAAQGKPLVDTHALGEADRATMAAMRQQLAPFKGRLSGPGARAPFDAVMEQTPRAQGVAEEPATLGGVAGWWLRPEGAREGAAILYLHGGAYVVGSARAYRRVAGQIAARAGAAVFVAEYRLAPEHPFPAAAEDAAAACRALAEGHGRLALAGDSAGGGLALVVLSLMAAEALRDGRAPPRGAAALSPWVDLALTGASVTERAERDPIMTARALAADAARYLAGHDARDPLASPLHGDLVGLPPVQIHVGEEEILRDDATRYAQAHAAAGGAAELHLWEGMPHGFQASLGRLEAAGAALDRVGAFLDARLGAS